MTNMTTGDFWNKVAVLANVFDGRVITGPMSINWMRRERRPADTLYPLGQLCEMKIFNPDDVSELTVNAHRLGLYITEQISNGCVVLIQPDD